MKLRARESGEAFDFTGKNGSDGWMDVTGIAGVWVNALIEKPEGCSEQGRT